MRLYRRAWLFVLLVGCGSNDGEAVRGVDSGEGAARSARAESSVERISDSVFVVRLANGSAVRFADTLRGTPRGRHWTYEGTVEEIGAVLIRAAFYEGSAYLLLNGTTGDSTWLAAPPVFSPDRRRFLTASIDLEAGYAPNRIRIYRASREMVASEWTLEAEGTEWGPSDARWLSGDTVRFVRNVQEFGSAVVEETGGPFRCASTPVQVVRSASDWRIDSAFVAPSETVAEPCVGGS